MISHIVEELFSIGSIKVGDFTFKSGIKSSNYIDLRPIISRPLLLAKIAESIWAKHTLTADCICGVPYTALPIATAIALKHNMPMVMRRKETKEYGTKKIVEGIYTPGQTCIIIEDVVTTGASIFETIADLETAGLKVIEVLAFVDREQGGQDNLEKAGYPFRAAVTRKEIADYLFNAGMINAEFRQKF